MDLPDAPPSPAADPARTGPRLRAHLVEAAPLLRDIEPILAAPPSKTLLEGRQGVLSGVHSGAYPGVHSGSPVLRGSATGGGLAALIHAEHGVVEVWREGVRFSELPEAELSAAKRSAVERLGAGHAANRPTYLETFPGGWIRRFPGGEEGECGVLLDAFPILAVQRRAGVDEPWSTTLWAPDDVSQETCVRVARSLPAWALQRFNRESPGDLDVAARAIEPALTPGDTADGQTPIAPRIPDVEAARAIVVNASLHRPPGTSLQRAIVLGGITPEGLTFLSRRELPEFALGALASGAWETAEWILTQALEGWLEDLIHDPTEDLGIPPVAPPAAHLGAPASAAALLTLTIRWLEWTGKVEGLRPHLATVDRWVDALLRDRDTEGPVSSLPAPDRLLDALAAALEPLGDRSRTEALKAHARSILVPPPTPMAPPVARGRKLPVIGQGIGQGQRQPDEDDAPPPRRQGDAHLPPWAAFAPPWDPSVTARRTVHAARLLRTFAERTLGIRPDAAWGRVTLAPNLVEAFSKAPDAPQPFTVEGIRVGDARISLDCRITESGGTFRVVQTGGRVPVNVVFEPLLPLQWVKGARFDDEPIQVGIESEPGGTRLRLQFPLDPERRIHIEGHR
jgi:hypothetical protein